MTAPRPPEYEIHFSADVAERLRRLQRRASRSGQGNRILKALRKIVRQLQRDPFEFGEPLYRLPALRMQVRSAVVRPLAVDFSIRENVRTVYVKGFRSLDEP